MNYLLLRTTRLLFSVLFFYQLHSADSIISKSPSRYIGQGEPKDFRKINSFKFVSLFGESTERSNKTKKIDRKSDYSFNSLDKSLTYIRDKKDRSLATFIGNVGTADVTVYEGSSEISFSEPVGAGHQQQLVITKFWDQENGGFIATYIRVFPFEI